MNFRPLFNNVVVKKIVVENVSKGGLVLISPLDTPPEGIVKATGPGKYNKFGIFVPCDVKVGDRVLFGKNSGKQVTIDGEEVIVMTDEEILGVIETIVSKTPAVVTEKPKLEVEEIIEVIPEVPLQKIVIEETISV